jgi:hypothetical protein
LNAATRERKLAKAKLWLHRLKAPAVNGQLIFFSDKKTSLKNRKLIENTTGGCA